MELFVPSGYMVIIYKCKREKYEEYAVQKIFAFECNKLVVLDSQDRLRSLRAVLTNCRTTAFSSLLQLRICEKISKDRILSIVYTESLIIVYTTDIDYK